MGITIPKKSELSRNLAAVPKLLLWTSCSIHTVSLTANLACLPIKTVGELGQGLTNGVPPRRFEAFPNCLAVNTAVQLYSRVLISKTYGGQLWKL